LSGVVQDGSRSLKHHTGPKKNIGLADFATVTKKRFFSFDTGKRFGDNNGSTVDANIDTLSSGSGRSQSSVKFRNWKRAANLN
jgi:hypothetical protein